MAHVKEDVLNEIFTQLKNIKFGTVLITVHNNEITQLDVTTKKRYEQSKVQSVSSNKILKK